MFLNQSCVLLFAVCKINELIGCKTGKSSVRPAHFPGQLKTNQLWQTYFHIYVWARQCMTHAIFSLKLYLKRVFTEQKISFFTFRLCQTPCPSLLLVYSCLPLPCFYFLLLCCLLLAYFYLLLCCCLLPCPLLVGEKACPRRPRLLCFLPANGK